MGFFVKKQLYFFMNLIQYIEDFLKFLSKKTKVFDLELYFSAYFTETEGMEDLALWI